MGATFFQQTKQITKTILTIITWTIFCLLILIIGFLIYYLVNTNLYARKGQKYEPAISLYTIVSPSMEPNIKVYDVIINKKTNPSTIQVGDVITFISTSNISNGMTVTHRVTAIVEGSEGLEFKTKGDNNLSEDTDTAKQKNVLGKVVMKIPQLGRLQFFLSSKGGWLLVVIFPALYIIVKDILKILKLSKAKKNVNEVDKKEEESSKIALEAFRKEEIRKRLNERELKKAKEIKERLRSKKKNFNSENNYVNYEKSINELEKNAKEFQKNIKQ